MECSLNIMAPLAPVLFVTSAYFTRAAARRAAAALLDGVLADGLNVFGTSWASRSKRSRLQFNRASWHHMSDCQLLLVHHDTVHYQLQDFLLDFILWVLKGRMHTGTELLESLDYPEFFCPLHVLLFDFLEPLTEDLAVVFRSLAPGL